jgi:hypothetical protein
MIVATINELPGFGFAEALRGDDGRTQRVGVMEVASGDALRLLRSIKRGEVLVYSGPVWVDDHWSAASFPVHLDEWSLSRDVSATLRFTERADMGVDASVQQVTSV